MQQSNFQGTTPAITDRGAGADRALVEMLPAISRRFRPLGLFLVAVAGDGSVCFHDEEASPAFIETVLSRCCNPAASSLHRVEPKITELPGGILGAADERELPWRGSSAQSHRRFLANCLLLVPVVVRPIRAFFSRRRRAANGRGASARRAMARRSGRGASRLFAGGCLAHRRICWSMPFAMKSGWPNPIRQVDSLSAQLANSYEELSLIYDNRGGMKVDRKPEDFFRQVCESLLNILSIGGVGVALRPGIMAEPIALYGRARDRRAGRSALDRLVADVLPMLARRPLPSRPTTCGRIASCRFSRLTPANSWPCRCSGRNR